MKTKIIISLFAAALLAGCFKKVSNNTTLVLKPLVQEISGGASVPLSQAAAYAFTVDTTTWGVASYDDALAGILTSKNNPSEKFNTPAATATPYEREGTQGWLQLPVGNLQLMVLAIDTENKIYGYTEHELGENLPMQYVSVVFKTWKEGKAYKDGNWSFYNEFYTPPVTVEFNIRPTIQASDGGTETAPTNFKAYAFPVDTTSWYIASYQDAVDGIITSKTNPDDTRTNPSPGYARDDIYWMTVSSSTLMVVAVDRTNRLYAYSRQDVDLQAPPVTVPIVFRTWRDVYLYVEDGWRVVDEALKPTPEPEVPVTPENQQSANNPARQ